MEIKEKQIIKSKDKFCAHFWTKTDNSFLKWIKTTKMLLQIFCQMKNVNFVWHFGQKTGMAGLINLNFPWRQKKSKKNPCWKNSVAIRRNENLFGGRHGKQLNRLAIRWIGFVFVVTKKLNLLIQGPRHQLSDISQILQKSQNKQIDVCC